MKLCTNWRWNSRKPSSSGPDVISVAAQITDQSMPRLTGLELAERLRQCRSDLPVVLYTGHGDGLAGADLTRAALHAVLRKPVDPVQLGQVLVRCLSAKAH